MTREDLVAMDSDMLLPEDVAEYLHLAPQVLRDQARTDASKLGFRVIVCGNRTLIPKWPFLEFIGEEPLGCKKEDICPRKLQESSCSVSRG